MANIGREQQQRLYVLLCSDAPVWLKALEAHHGHNRSTPAYKRKSVFKYHIVAVLELEGRTWSVGESQQSGAVTTTTIMAAWLFSYCKYFVNIFVTIF